MIAFFARWIPAPLAMCLFTLAPTRAMRVGVIDGPDTRYIGFPLPWRSDLHISSGASEIYLGPLAIDMAAYALVAFALVRVWRRIPVLSDGTISRIAAALVWIGGALLFALMIAITSVLDTFYDLWYDPTIWNRVISIGWGGV